MQKRKILVRSFEGAEDLLQQDSDVDAVVSVGGKNRPMPIGADKRGQFLRLEFDDLEDIDEERLLAGESAGREIDGAEKITLPETLTSAAVGDSDISVGGNSEGVSSFP